MNKGLTGAELANALAAIKDAQAHGVLGSAVMMLKAKIASLVGTFKTLWAAMLANPATAVIAVVAAGTAAWVAYQAAHEKSLKSLKESLDETKGRISSVTDKINDNKTRIEELQKLKTDGTISTAEEAELQALTKQTEQYEAQLRFLQEIEKHKTKEYDNKRLEEAREAYNEYTSYGEYGKDIETWNATRTTKGFGGMQNAVEDYNAALAKLAETQKQIRDFTPDGTEQSAKEAERLEKQLDKDQAKVDTYFAELEDHYLELIALREQFDGLDSDEARAMVSSIDGWMQQIADITQVSTPFEKFQKNVKSLSADTVKALASNKDLTRMQKAEFEEWAEQVGYAKEDIKDLAIYFQRLLGIDTTGSSGDSIRDRIVQAREDLQNVRDEMSRLGISANDTIFGNIDADNRQILEWTDENIEKFKDALESWGEDIDALRGEYSTIMGTSSEYDGLEIAFTPILQTDHGPELLSAETVDEYIWALLDKVRNLHENGEWSTEDLLELDARGIEIDGKKIRGVIADVGHAGEESGEKVRKIAEAMHFVGKNGELARVTKELDDARAAAHDYIQNYIAKDIGNLGSLRDELAQTSKAWEEYNKTLEGGDRGDAANQMAQAYQKAMEDIENGRIDTKAVWGAAKLLFSDQQLAEWKYDLTRIAQELSGPMMQALFSGGEDDDTEIGVKFANYIKEHAAELESAGAHILDQGDGKFQFWYDSLGKLAQSLGMSEEAVTSLLDALDAYGVQSMQSGDDITKLADQFREIRNNSLTAKDAVMEFIQAMATGENALNEHEIIENLKALKENGVITGNDYDFSMMIKEVFDELNQVDNAEADATVKLDDQATPAADPIRQHLEEIFAEPIEQKVVLEYAEEKNGTAGRTAYPAPKSHSTHSYARADYLHDAGVSIDPEQIVAEHAASFESSGKTRRQNIETHETVTVTVGADITPAEESIGALHEGLKGVDETEVSAEAGLDTDPAYDNLNGLVNDLNDFASTDVHKTVYIDYYDNDQTSGVKTNTDLVKGSASASGTKNAPGGPTLVNELGPELISDNGEAFIANGGKPGFVNLGKGAIVFTADETKEIFRKEYSNVPVRAYADGTPNRASLRDRLIRGEKAKGAYTGGVSKTFTCIKCGHSWQYSPIDYPNGPTGACPKCGAYYINSVYQYGGNTVAPEHQYDDYYAYDATTGAPINNYDDIYNNYVEHGYYGPQDSHYDSGYVHEKQCPNCGKAISFNLTTCPHCGYNYATGRVPYKSAQNVDTSKYKGAQATTGGSSGYAGSSSYPGSADYASESEPQKVDWIAVLVNRIQKTVSSLEKIASSGFKSLATRTEAATKEISELYQEIDAENAGYARYMQEANAVGLSSDIVAKIKDGTIDIEEYDADTRALIDKFSEWYEKALECKEVAADLREEVADLYTTMFDNTQTDYENQLALIDHSMNMQNKRIEAAKAAGYLDNSQYYEALSKIETQRISKLQEEYITLQEKFKEAMNSGEIERYSEAWYHMALAINSVEESIADAQIRMIGYQNSLKEVADTMRNIEWDYFDYAHEQFRRLQSEADFLIGIMANDKLFESDGTLASKGEATLGLHVLNYNAYMAQADAYRREIEEKFSGDLNEKEQIDRRNALLDLQMQSIQAAESEKDAIRDLVSNGIQLELKAMQDLIKAYEDSLDSAKDLFSYQKKVSEQTDDISKLSKQLTAYRGDNSEENRARVQKLNEQIKKANDELQETEWEHNISEQKKLLNELYNEYSDYMDTRIDDLEQLVKDATDKVNQNLESINSEIKNSAEQVGYTLSGGMSEIMSNGTFAYYNRMFDGVTSVIAYLSKIYDFVRTVSGFRDEQAPQDFTMMPDSFQQWTQNDFDYESHDQESTSGTIVDLGNGVFGRDLGNGLYEEVIVEDGLGTSSGSTRSNSSDNDTRATSSIDVLGERVNIKRERTSNGNDELVTFSLASDPSITNMQLLSVLNGNPNQLKEILKSLFNRAHTDRHYSNSDFNGVALPFSTGGLADYTGLAMLHGTKTRPELVLNADDTEKFLEAAKLMRTPVLSALTDRSFRLPGIGEGLAGGITIENFAVDFNLDNVSSYEEILTEARNDTRFERLVDSIVFSKMRGRSSFGEKNRIHL